MSIPTEFDAAIVRIGTTGNTPTFSVLCGLENVSINESANTTDKFPFDCAKPGKPSVRTIRINSTQFSVTGSGVTDVAEVARRKAALGAHLPYEIDAIRYDGTDEGEVLGTFSFDGVLTTSNLSMARQGDSGSEVTIEGEGELTWTPAA